MLFRRGHYLCLANSNGTFRTVNKKGLGLVLACNDRRALERKEAELLPDERPKLL